MKPEILRQLRKEHGLSQAKLAKLLGISASAVGMYEQGRREPDGNLLMRMASVLHCSTDELLGADAPHDVSDVIDRFARTLERQPGLMFNGVPMTPADREKLANAIRVAAAVSSGRN